MTEQYTPSLDDAKDVYVEATRDPVAWGLADLDVPDESVIGAGWDRMIAQVRAEAIRAGWDRMIAQVRAEAIRSARDEIMPPVNCELRPDGTEDPGAAEYVAVMNEVHDRLGWIADRIEREEQS